MKVRISIQEFGLMLIVKEVIEKLCNKTINRCNHAAIHINKSKTRIR